MSAQQALIDLIRSTDARAIALIGRWGRGKTWLWKHVVNTTTQQARAKYSYVSLFGVNSLDDLKLAIFQKEIEAGPPPQELGFLQKAWRKTPWRTVTDAATQLENPWLGNLNALYRTAAFSRVKNRLICIDDFERKGKNLELEEVLGLITFLCEERGCSVVLILNDQTMEGFEDWNKYREKVFHAELSYLPTTQACLDIMFGKDVQDHWYNGAREVLAQLDVSNMRIMGRIKYAIAPLAERYPTASQATKEQIGSTLALYSYCHNASGEGAPPIERALRNPYQRLMIAAKEDVRTEEERRWDSILSKVDFYPNDLDLAVIDYLQNGYMDTAKFDEQVALIEARLQANSIDNAFTSAWRAYHDSFHDNAEEVVDLFRKAFPHAAPSMNAMNANATISLMRRLGNEQLADEFIVQWVDPRRGARRRELSIREAEIFGPLTDGAFIQALKQAELEEATEPDLAEAMAIIASGQGSVDQALQTVSLADIDSIVNWLESNAGRVSRSFMATAMQFAGSSHVGEAQRLIREALENIAAKSTINELRVRSLLKSASPE